jgi:hypothetical protein
MDGEGKEVMSHPNHVEEFKREMEARRKAEEMASNAKPLSESEAGQLHAEITHTKMLLLHAMTLALVQTKQEILTEVEKMIKEAGR